MVGYINLMREQAVARLPTPKTPQRLSDTAIIENTPGCFYPVDNSTQQNPTEPEPEAIILTCPICLSDHDTTAWQ